MKKENYCRGLLGINPHLSQGVKKNLCSCRFIRNDTLFSLPKDKRLGILFRKKLQKVASYFYKVYSFHISTLWKKHAFTSTCMCLLTGVQVHVSQTRSSFSSAALFQLQGTNKKQLPDANRLCVFAY